MKQLTAFEAPAIKAVLVPVRIGGSKLSAHRAPYVRMWNERVRVWHRTGGQA